MELKEQIELDSVSFSVDETARTIRGLVVPWNAVSTPKSGKRFSFARDALRAVAAKFVKFFEDHNPANSRGRAIDMQETDAGLEMTFQVYPGVAGDRMLALAKSGAKTGLSVGVEFDEQDTEPDPNNDGAFLVKLANLYEVSLVERPSFDNSRVITVMASVEMDQIMTDNETKPTAEEVVAKNEQVKPVTFALPEGYKLVPNTVEEAPKVIEPRRVAQVTEPENYVFDADGNLHNGKHDFGVDLIQGWNPDFNDLGARQRAEEFVNLVFAPEGLVTSNVNELAPTRNVPKYIDQKDYRNPVFDTINKGSVKSMNGGGTTPFQWPVKSSSSGLVAAGVEGEEPVVGTYVTTLGSVTPTTLRGKAAISREAWDAGTAPNLGTVIWTQMTRDYNEALEANIVATLNAASPTSLGTFTAGGGTTGQTLALEMRQNLARLQFARGGKTMRYLFAQADLYLALISAQSDDGRQLFPAVGPTNADGTVSTDFAAINVNGTLVLPTWALAAAGQTTAQSSYLIDPANVDGWVDAPRRIMMPEVAVSNVYLGIFGYVATAISDITGVREVLYDPTA